MKLDGPIPALIVVVDVPILGFADNLVHDATSAGHFLFGMTYIAFIFAVCDIILCCVLVFHNC